jgi:2-methylcitrate dehydratase PrpD
VTIRLRDGQTVARQVDEFDGMPARPLTRAALRDKFTTLMRGSDVGAAADAFERLQNLEDAADLQWVGAP